MKKLTTEEFIEKAKKIHGDKYNYSLTEYKSAIEKIQIVCPEHGIFLQTPHGHLSGRGCPVCAGREKITTENFIKKAKKIHGDDKYDYSLAEYKSATTKLQIICPKHGIFLQTPHDHLSGCGCPTCAGREKITTENFIEKAKQVHGENKYDYSMVQYKRGDKKVEIICPKHGIFLQTPNSHLRGSGCPVCAGRKKLTTEEFIEKAKQVHGDGKYDYSKTEYKGNNKIKVIITCPIHGDFLQKPNSHLSGHDCPQCALEQRSEKRRTSKEEFIKRAIAIHHDENGEPLYDYSRIQQYVNTDTKVCIVCKIHGEFWQTPHSHLEGRGCPDCSFSQGERRVEKWLNDNSFLKNEDYIFQYRADWLNKQSLDFYLPELKIGIEYDGRQHFEPIELWGGEEHLKLVQKLDQQKDQLCKENNVNLIRISYMEFDNIETILSDRIKEVVA